MTVRPGHSEDHVFSGSFLPDTVRARKEERFSGSSTPSALLSGPSNLGYHEDSSSSVFGFSREGGWEQHH